MAVIAWTSRGNSPFEEALRIFEVLNSQYLELNTDRGLVVTDKVIAKEFEMDGECLFNFRIIILYCIHVHTCTIRFR